MKKIVKYQAEDGTLFESHTECEQYETIVKVRKIIDDNVNLPSAHLTEIIATIKSNPKLFKKLCNFYI